jgi:Dyp-type peroxidase family
VTPTEPAEPIPPLDNLQGGIIGFNKDHHRFVYLGFADQATARSFVGELEPLVARGSEVLRFNALFKETKDRGAPEGTVEATWINIAFTGAGLQLLGAPDFDRLPEEYKVGMAGRAAVIGDVDESAPEKWAQPFLAPNFHAVITIAADEPDDLNDAYTLLQGLFAKHTVSELGQHDGNARSGEFRGREHFGFKDGVSQPGIRGLTTSSKVGQDEIAAGEFIVGYPNQDGQISGGAPSASDPQPGQPGYGGAPPTPATGLPSWAKDGSFVVLRRLFQDVGGLNKFLDDHGAEVGLSADQLGAKFVGRWKSGAPLERTRDEAEDFDPTTEDPSIKDPTLLGNDKIDNFDYEPQDSDGLFVPHTAHIRKMNPRSSQPKGKEESNRHRILRRGIPYGPDFQPSEPAYPGTGAPADQQDRGLMFVCYQASIATAFEFIQQSWANNENFTQDQDGRDPIISQDVAEPQFKLPPDKHLVTQRWVLTRGGAYLFAPSITALRFLAGQQPAA